jgi:3-oxoacyl-[acyl-carrier protein] reductase
MPIYAPVTSKFSSMSRVVLVTGANRGIGAAIAHAFASQGDVVIAGHRSPHRPSELPSVLKDVQIDVRDPVSVDAAFDLIEKEWGSVEVLVANAGITKDNLMLRMSNDDFRDVVSTNLEGAFYCAKRASKGMLKFKKGRIIFIGSVVGSIGSAGQVNYAATKAGLVGMARSIARELGSRSITANVIAPGFVETEMTGDLTADRREEILNAVALNRFASVEEIGDVAVFLASPAAAYITGAIIPVDGGLGMGH